jgi:uncharacterized membrane protein
MPQAANASVWLTLFWTLGGAFLFSAWLDDFSGFALGGLVGYLIAQSRTLALRLHDLERRLRWLESAPAAKPPTTAPIPQPVPEREPPQVVVTVPTASPAPVRLPSSWDSAPASAPSAAAAVPANPSGAQRWIEYGLAWLKRGNPVARVGIVILFFGGVFLAKYAAEHSMLPLELRLAALAGGALALLVLGWRLRARRRMYAQILQGGGVAGLYLTVFAAARLYHLLPQDFALPLLIIVAIASALLAVAQNALALAVIGFAGGFLAPLLLSTGGGNHVALFSYYTVLNLGVFAVAWFRAWRVLNLLGFVFTFSITGAWRTLSYQPEQLASADFFLLLFFLLYVAISILFALRQKPDLRGYVSGSLVFGLPVVAFSLHASLISKVAYGLAFSALGFGLFYLALAFSLFLSRRPNLTLLAEAFAALGVVFASLAVPLAFDQQTTAAMWAVEGAGLLWIGIRQQRKLARAFGLLLQAAAGAGYLARVMDLQTATPILNSAYVGTVLLAVSGILCAWWLHRNRATIAPYESSLPVAGALWSTAWWLYGGLAELDRSSPAETEYGASLIFAATTLLIGDALTRRWQWQAPARIATALLPLAAVFGLLAIRASHPLAHLGYLGWPLLLAAGYWLLYRLELAPDDSRTPFLPLLHGGLYALLALVTAWECAWRIGDTVPGVWQQLPVGLIPALMLWIANRANPRPRWPLLRHRDIYQRYGSAPLAAAVALWIVTANLSSTGDPGWLPYVPLLNPLDLASALALLTLAYWWLALSTEQRGAFWGGSSLVLWTAAAALVFVWLNAALVRALHYGFDTPLHFHGIRHSFLVQASLSIFWGLLGLSAMTLAARRARREIWIAGAALMAVVVVKLFLVDLEGGGTLARIASFLTVGALLLAAGYLSPLPPSIPENKTA